MQSGYGGVSEFPQFMVDSCGNSSLFAISSSGGNAPVAAAAAAPPELKYHILPYHHHHLPQQAPLLPHFSPFQYPMPITQQLLQQPHHQFQLFQHHHPPPQMEAQSLIPQHPVALDQDSGPENSASPTPPIMGGAGGVAPAAAPAVPPFLSAAMNFKLGVNESSCAGSQEVNNDDDGMLQGDDDGSESRLNLWQREDDSSIKELPWRPLDIDYINKNNKRCNDKEPEASASKYCKKSKELAAKSDDGGHATVGRNYKLFSELEAIYQPGGSGATNQTGSGSALTPGETPIMDYVTVDVTGALPTADQRASESETSAGEEAVLKKPSKSSGGRRRRKRRLQQQLSSVAAFFENLVKQLMDHQEDLHKRFLEVMEKRDQERTSRDEAWRKQEASKSSGEAAARARERALASSRQAAIVAFLEKITGESLNFPPDTQFTEDDPHKKDGNDIADLQTEPISPDHVFNSALVEAGNKLTFNGSRWPKAEVEALIQVRSGLESRFQEPGLKGPLWEKVSATMSAMGYSRSAKRCKEKWENINKYFRKAKEKGKKRSQRSKTCPYFQQLDQIYSKSLANKPPPSPRPSSATPSTPVVAATGNIMGSSELLDAIIVSTADEASGSKLAVKKAAIEPHGDNSKHDQLDGDVDDDDEELERGVENEERAPWPRREFPGKKNTESNATSTRATS